MTASSAPAAVSAGMPRKNDSRVAVTRSMSRSRPAEIVAPDRETPGISAKHWASADDEAVLQRDVALVALLGGGVLGEHHHARPQDQPARDHPQAAQRTLDEVLAEQADDRDRAASR